MTTLDLYGSNTEIFKQFSIKDALFVHYNCPQRDKIMQLYSQHNQLLFTISGEKIFRHGDDTFFAKPNTTFLLKRSAFLQELPDDYTGFEVLVFYVKDDYLKSIFEEYRTFLPLRSLQEVTQKMFIPFDVNDSIYSNYRDILPYFEQKNRLPESILEARIKELIFRILDHPANGQLLSYIKNVADEIKTPIYEVMEANYMYDLKLADFASLAQRSLATFKREFVQYYHTSPGKWLTQRRFKRAKSLLETSRMPIGEIVFECGFVNLSHFSRVFKANLGISPSQYRHQFQNK